VPSSERDKRLRAELAAELGWYPADLDDESIARHREVTRWRGVGIQREVCLLLRGNATQLAATSSSLDTRQPVFKTSESYRWGSAMTQAKPSNSGTRIRARPHPCWGAGGARSKTDPGLRLKSGSIRNTRVPSSVAAGVKWSRSGILRSNIDSGRSSCQAPSLASPRSAPGRHQFRRRRECWLDRANATLRSVKSAWIKEQSVDVVNGACCLPRQLARHLRPRVADPWAHRRVSRGQPRRTQTGHRWPPRLASRRPAR
jgi:hypothetical protein